MRSSDASWLASVEIGTSTRFEKASMLSPSSANLPSFSFTAYQIAPVSQLENIDRKPGFNPPTLYNSIRLSKAVGTRSKLGIGASASRVFAVLRVSVMPDTTISFVLIPAG